MHYLSEETYVRNDHHNIMADPGSVILTPSEVDCFVFNILPLYRDEMHKEARRLRQALRLVSGGFEAARNLHNSGSLLAGQFEREVNKAQEWMALMVGPGE